LYTILKLAVHTSTLAVMILQTIRYELGSRLWKATYAVHDGIDKPAFILYCLDDVLVRLGL